MSLYKEFRENYPSTVRHNEKIMTIHRINELEDKTELTFDERMELDHLKHKEKRL